MYGNNNDEGRKIRKDKDRSKYFPEFLFPLTFYYYKLFLVTTIHLTKNANTIISHFVLENVLQQFFIPFISFVSHFFFRRRIPLSLVNLWNENNKIIGINTAKLFSRLQFLLFTVFILFAKRMVTKSNIMGCHLKYGEHSCVLFAVSRKRKVCVCFCGEC